VKYKLVPNEQGEYEWVPANKARKAPPRAVDAPVVDDFALGCIASQVEEFRADDALSGFKDVEYTPDPEIEGWFNIKVPNQRRYAKYAKHCGKEDKNGQHAGKTITAQELKDAERLVRERHPLKDAK
jgi:hypothetical protein